jgi:hypothetical protein
MPNDLNAGLDRIESGAALRLTQPHLASTTVTGSLSELRKILHDLAGGNWEERPGSRKESAAAFEEARMTAGPGETEPMHGRPAAPVTPAAAAPGTLPGNAVAIYTPAVVPENPSYRRNGTALLALATAALAALGVTGLGMVRQPVLSYLAASASGTRQIRRDGSATMARAALPSRLLLAPADSAVAGPSAKAAPRQVAAGGYRVPLGGNILPAAFQPSQAAAPRPVSVLRRASTSPVAVAPRPAGTALSLPSRLAPAPTPSSRAPLSRAPSSRVTSSRATSSRATSSRAALSPTASSPATSPRPAPPTPAQSAAQRRAGEGLRQAGDMRIVEGDIASARLFYERAADAGDAQAALDLGNSFNPALLKRLGVLGMQGDVAAAARWYRRARILGDPDARQALQTLLRSSPIAQ